MTTNEILKDVTDIIIEYNSSSRQMTREEVQYKRDALSTYLTMLTDEYAGLFGNYQQAEDDRKEAFAKAYKQAKSEGMTVKDAEFEAELQIKEHRETERDWKVGFYRMKEVAVRGAKVLDSMASRLHFLEKLNND